MKTALCLLLLLPASALSSPAGTPENLRVAVLDFQTDGSVEKKYGVKDAGVTVANLLTVDLSGLVPVSVVDRQSVQKQVGDQRLDLASPIATEDAKWIGRELGAAIFVNGRVYSSGEQIIIAAREVSAETGQTLGTMVQGDRKAAFADLISQLGMQVGKIVLGQQGVASKPWSSATVVGTCKRGSFLVNDEVACVMDVDGRHIPDETERWSHAQPLLPGLHEIFVRYYDGTSTAGQSFVIDAMPGSAYEVRYSRQPNMNPRLWIQDRNSQRPVTAMVEAPIGARLPEEGAFYGWGPFTFPSTTDNPTFVPSSQRPTK